MSWLEDLAGEYRDQKARLQRTREELFTGQETELLERLKRVCTLIAHTIPAPTCCGDEGSIEHDIAKMSIKEMQDGNYPMSSIEWDIERDHFTAEIEAYFRGETDCATRITFPIETSAFEAYCEQLQASADLIAKQFEQRKAEEKVRKEQEERELFKRLQEKYKA